MLILLTHARKESVLINPYSLFVSTPASLIVYNSSVSSYYLPPLSFKTQLFILLSLLCFFLGLRIGNKIKLRYRHSQIYNGWHFILIGLIPYAIGYLYVGWPLLAGNPDQVKSLFFQPVIGQLSLFYTAGLVVYFRKRKTKEVIILSILFLVLSVLVLAKLAVLMTVLGIVFLSSRYYRALFKGNKVTIVLFFIFFLFISLFSILGNLRNVDNVKFAWEDEIHFNNETLDKYGEFLYAPYYYFVTPWTNLEYNIENWDEFGHGVFISKPIVSLLQLDQHFSVEKKMIRNDPWNTHTFLADFYCDFGFVGSLVTTFFLGSFVTIIYRKAIVSGNTLDEALWIYTGCAVLMMFFSNHFTSVGYPVIALVLFYMYRQIYKVISEG